MLTGEIEKNIQLKKTQHKLTNKTHNLSHETKITL